MCLTPWCCEGAIIYAAVFLSSTVQRAERPDHHSTILALSHILPHTERENWLTQHLQPALVVDQPTDRGVTRLVETKWPENPTRLVPKVSFMSFHTWLWRERPWVWNRTQLISTLSLSGIETSDLKKKVWVRKWRMCSLKDTGFYHAWLSK